MEVEKICLAIDLSYQNYQQNKELNYKLYKDQKPNEHIDYEGNETTQKSLNFIRQKIIEDADLHLQEIAPATYFEVDINQNIARDLVDKNLDTNLNNSMQLPMEGDGGNTSGIARQTHEFLFSKSQAANKTDHKRR